LVVPSSDAFAPLPAAGALVVKSGGQAAAQAPVHVLFPPVSASHRYSVLPRESTRIEPSPLFATPTVADAVLEVFAVGVEADAGGDAVAALPPQAATARAPSGITAAPATEAMSLRRLMLLLRLGSIDGRSGERASHHATRSPRPETS
jgi:hypothetical protein